MVIPIALRVCGYCHNPVIAGQFAYQIDVSYGYAISDVALSLDNKNESVLYFHSGCWLIEVLPRIKDTVSK